MGSLPVNILIGQYCAVREFDVDRVIDALPYVVLLRFKLISRFGATSRDVRDKNGAKYAFCI
jgi:hypothetical protein